MLLHNERSSHLCTVLVAQVSKTGRLIGVVRVIIDEGFALTEIACDTVRVYLGHHLHQVAQYLLNFLLRRALLPLVNVSHDALGAHLDSEQVEALQVADLRVQVLQVSAQITATNEVRLEIVLLAHLFGSGAILATDSSRLKTAL